MMSDLPRHVYAVRDRHGKIRHRFMRKGWKGGYLPGAPCSAEFHRAYAAIIEGGPSEPAPVKAVRAVAPRSFDDLVARFKRSVRWKKKGARTQYKQARILERFTDRTDAKGRRYGERPVASITVTWLENVFGQMAETPAAANELRKVLAGVIDFAIALEWRENNPARLTASYDEGDGFHDWTDGEIAQYRARHPLGTMARLTLELALNTAARRCNVNKIEREHIKAGEITVAHAKGNHETSVPMLATTKAAIDALPAAPIRYLVTTAFGKPFSDAGMGNKMRQWCDEAGLPQCSMHGLRKAMSRHLAESGATDAQGMAVTGHKKDKTFAKYRAKADRRALAGRAVSNLGPLADFQPTEEGGKSDV